MCMVLFFEMLPQFGAMTFRVPDRKSRIVFIERDYLLSNNALYAISISLTISP